MKMQMTALELAREMPANDTVVKILEALKNDDGEAADVAYLPGLSRGMIGAGDLFGYFTQLLLNDKVKILAINGSDGRGVSNPKPGGTWPGRDWYVSELAARGVPNDKIIPLSGSQGYSREETDSLLEEARRQNWNRIIVVSVDYHRPRQVLGCIAKMQQMNWRTRLYFPPTPFDWDAGMIGSQQREASTGRLEAENDWNKKVPAYQTKGDLASLEDFFGYIAWRNA